MESTDLNLSGVCQWRRKQKNDQSVIEFNIDNNSMALNLNQFDLS